MPDRFRLIPIFLYTALIFASGYLVGQSGWPLLQLGVATASVPTEAREVFDPFWEVWNLVDERYYEQPVDPAALTQGAIEGMLATLDDPHTRYLPPAMEEAARENMEGELQGIGVLVEDIEGEVTVISPFEGSPAEAAGLEPGDVLLEADGVELTGLGLAAAANLIRGPAGTTVHLVVQRDGETFEVDVTRDLIRIPSVRSEMVEGNIAYVRLSRFGNQTASELNEALESLLPQDPTGLILDLRNNPGGGLTSAVDVADEFLGDGVVLVESFGSGEERVFESTAEGSAEEIPMVVLINEGSASASEVLAGALRDRGRAILIGQQSFGKGTVQTWHGLSNGGGVRITVARWLTPDGDWVTGDGLVPDLVVPLPEQVEEGSATDPQLDAAIDYLQENRATNR